MKQTFTINGHKYRLGRNIDLDEEVVLDSHGERITEARAQEMAAEALEFLGFGRPPLSDPHALSHRISFRVPESLAKRAEELAASRARLSLSWDARRSSGTS